MYLNDSKNKLTMCKGMFSEFIKLIFKKESV